MPIVRLLSRVAQHKAGALVDYPDTEAEWLINAGKAERVQRTTTIEQVTDPDNGEGEDADPNAGDRDRDEQPTPNAPTLAELQAQAKDLGLATYGSKAQLADRIEQERRRLGEDTEDDHDSDELD